MIGIGKSIVIDILHTASTGESHRGESSSRKKKRYLYNAYSKLKHICLPRPWTLFLVAPCESGSGRVPGPHANGPIESRISGPDGTSLRRGRVGAGQCGSGTRRVSVLKLS